MKRIVIIGGGIVGLAIARELSLKGKKRITIIEKESEIATHQSARNSGVMHAGLYYKPGSLKAELSRNGINLMKNYCNKMNISWKESGKIVAALHPNDTEQIERLYDWGLKNKLVGIRKLNKKGINLIEPHLNSKLGIHVPEESIVNYKDVSNSFLNEIKTYGVEIKYKSKLSSFNKSNKEIKLENGEAIKADIFISAAGLFSDKVSETLGLDINHQKIIPFRGEYYNLKDEFNFLVNSLIYPVTRSNLPFLGVHFTKMLNGTVEAGPNAVLALAREGYDWRKFNLEEFKDAISYPGLRKFIQKFPLITLGEVGRSLSKKFFVKSLQKLIPEIKGHMLERGDSGVRAQLMNMKGELVQDFDIRIKDNVVSILNAPSPAATSSIAIAKYIVNYLEI